MQVPDENLPPDFEDDDISAVADDETGSRADAGSAKPDAAAVTNTPNPATDKPTPSGASGDAAVLAVVDAAVSTGGDAGSIATSDAGSPADSGAPSVSAAGVCGGETPHGCYTPQADNPSGCPPQIHEQSAFYPPLDEWEACESPFYQPCNYTKPGGGEASCSCDLGLHWLCSY